MIGRTQKKPDTPDNAYAVILAGGGGTRLWPKSRKNLPKHFISIVGQDTMLQTTYNRTTQLFPKERILVITNKEHVNFVRDQLTDLPKDNIIAEPFPNNTALAMGTAAAFVSKRDPEGVIIYFAADHIIEDKKKFKAAVLCSLEIAGKTENIVTIGIRPTFAHIGLGYIRVGDQFGRVVVDGEDVFAFKGRGFKEKPNLATAQAFLGSEQYLWNANIYCWGVKTIFAAFEEHHPGIYKSLEKMLKIIDTKDEVSELKKIYEKTENIPIDYAVSEKAKNIVVVPGEFEWSDVGDWKVVYDIQPKSEQGMVVVGDKNNLVSIDSKDSLVELNGRMIAVVGLKDIVVVDTGDITLICAKDRTQDVKKVVEELKRLKKERYL